MITKTNRLSTVHRRAKMDYIGSGMSGPDGEVIGEARLIGLVHLEDVHDPRHPDPFAAPQT